MFVIVAGMSKVPGLCVIHTWSHVCHRGWNVQSSRIVCYTYLISCLSLWLECLKFQDCVLYIPDLMFVIVTGMSKVPGLCVIHTWSHVCHCDWNVQSSRIVCYTYLISCLSLWLECLKFQDCMLYIPDLMFVIVAGISKVPGLCVIHTWSHVCQHDWNVQSSRIVC
jgi:hypothetical protein